ncbi:MAG: 3-deoxy-8-phosphooctulonate synthase [Bacteriovoracaceae bacterium]
MRKLEIYLGPCVLESKQLAFDIAGSLKEDLHHLEHEIDLTFKGSFDKANRSAIDSYRGPGIEKGLKVLEDVKKELHLKTVTDFHLPQQAEEVASVVDVLQVPAFLCRQTDMIVAGAEACKKHGGILKVKKGQFLSPDDMKNVVDKVKNFLSLDQLRLTERGTSFGYNNLVVDMASFQIMKGFGVKTVHDATHCVQRPGGHGKTSGGKREFVETLARAAVAAGADGVFMETHPTPDKALSDPATSLPLESVPKLIENLLKLFREI